ncbi:Uu.00g076180.m01.CDS01 [Anthostomella pinea]|uniref:Uu.00g076180.m01.CDS01 n=1 Tax=Anthostomella pinea TaxID=933095 RepID=A0AAI8VVV1_9PEZI|nr:Uu.00g076180.m01.CDS01 [Anthostomella pinea]
MRKRQQQRGRNAQLRRALIATGQTIFAILLLTIFGLAIVIQSGLIRLPQWAKTFQGAPPDVLAAYSGALMGMVCGLAVLLFGFAVWVYRSDSAHAL